jgi:hypothetical protein
MSRHVRAEARRNRHAATGAFGLGLLLALAGCAAPEPELETYELSIRIESDPGRPIAGATVNGAAQFRSVSDATGVVRLRVNGEPGQRLRFQVRCPDGYRSPEQPLDVLLTRLGADAPPPEYGVRCAPEVRTVVIAVRAQNGAGLPVTQLGREVARTDRAGAAHVVMQLAPHEPVELSIDTSSQPKLEPQNPTQRFEAPDTDAVLLFDAPFVKEKPRPRAAPRRPTRI